MKTQRELIKEWLIKGHSITQLQALKKWGVGCLHSRITEIRKLYHIDTTMIPVKTRRGFSRVARYKMVKEYKG